MNNGNSFSSRKDGMRFMCFLVLALICACGFIHCGQPIAGGGSEVGNPTLTRRNSESDSSAGKAVGFEINAGTGIRIIRKTNQPLPDSAAKQP